MLVRFSDMTMYNRDLDEKYFIITPYSEIDVHDKSLRDILKKHHVNGYLLNETNSSLRINFREEQVNWSMPFVDAVAQCVAQSIGKDFNDNDVSLSHSKVTVVLNKVKPFYVKDVCVTIRPLDCLVGFCKPFLVCFDLEYHTVRQLEEAVNRHVFDMKSPDQLSIEFKGQWLNELRRAPLWWFGIKDGAEINLHYHSKEVSCNEEMWKHDPMFRSLTCTSLLKIEELDDILSDHGLTTKTIR